MNLDNALGAMRSVPQFFAWYLQWDGTEGKYKKTPCALDGSPHPIDAGLPANWNTYETVVPRVAALNAALGEDTTRRYALGFRLTADCPYWFFDLDKCSAGDGVLSERAAAMVAAFPGALVEWSSSMKGLHIIGRCAGSVPAHRSRDIHKMHMEFYTEGRGIAFGLSGEAQGNADSCHDASVASLIEHYFPPRAPGEMGEGPRAEWRGPADDDALIDKALAARSSAAVAFGGKASFGQLWRGEVEQCSEHDMALASHLAFWTGCDAERIERLMRRSGLARAKWNEHKTYLRDLTIANACSLCGDVYQEPERNLAAAVGAYGTQVTLALPSGGEVISVEVAARVRELLDLVSAAGTVEQMHNEVIPVIQSSGVPRVYCEQFVRAINAKLDIWGAKLPVGQLRGILFPPAVMGVSGVEAPLWLQQHCYVKEGDFFYDCLNGGRMTYQGFIAEYSRLMPLKDNGARENPVEWAFSRWNIRTVHRLEYRPDEGAYFMREGLDYANSYVPSSVPVPAGAYTDAGLAGIDALQRMLFDMCGRREAVYMALIRWVAHNALHPGIKIRWSPIIKGCMGDGKTLFSNVIRAAIGYRNVNVTGNNTIKAQGGFNDWAVGHVVNILEEVMLYGKERHGLYNAMNEFITNDVVSINAKGKVAYMTRNVTNHLAFTNYNDALPLPGNDRRWMVIYTPWMSLDAMKVYGGMSDEDWAARTLAIDTLWRAHADELRAWLLSVPMEGFDARGSAPVTPEKSRMMASGQDDAEAIAQGIIEEGANGVTVNVLSSACLSNILKIKGAVEGFEVPRSTALNHMLTRMGYSKINKQIKWKGGVHTIWIKNGFVEDSHAIRLELDKPST